MAEYDKPKTLKSTATVKRKDVFEQISTTTGLPPEHIEAVFRAYADIARNNLTDGYNIVFPFIGVLKIVKQYIPETYNREIAKKYGTIDIPKFKRQHRFTVLFGPMLALNPNYRLLITDSLPTNQAAHELKKMPFENNTKKFNFNNSVYDTITEEDTDANEAVFLDNDTTDDKNVGS